MKMLVDEFNIEPYLFENYNKLIDLIKVPGEIRNKNAGHGSVDSKTIPDCLVKYEIDLVASSILFLVRLYQDEHA